MQTFEGSEGNDEECSREDRTAGGGLAPKGASSPTENELQNAQATRWMAVEAQQTAEEELAKMKTLLVQSQRNEKLKEQEAIKAQRDKLDLLKKNPKFRIKTQGE